MVIWPVLPVKQLSLVKGMGGCYIADMASSPAFQRVAGHVALDFVNTVDDWTTAQPHDHIPDFAAALRFGIAVGALSSGEGRRLAAMKPGVELRRLRELRSRLERVFRASVVGRRPLPADLTALSRECADAARVAHLRRSGGRLVREVDARAARACTLRLRIVEAAVALLTSSQLARLKTCPSCGWVFLDASKNGSRRWCSMAMCGSNAKARRYYWRTKQRSSWRKRQRASSRTRQRASSRTRLQASSRTRQQASSRAKQRTGWLKERRRSWRTKQRPGWREKLPSSARTGPDG